MLNNKSDTNYMFDLQDDNRLLQPSHENDNKDGERKQQGQSEGKIYEEEIRREVELSPLRKNIETESE